MIHYTEAQLKQVSVHRTGNKLLDEPLQLSELPLELSDPQLSALLMSYFLDPFGKPMETFRFSHSSGQLSLNELYHFATGLFDEPASFHEQSQQIARHLFETSNHPRIKGGELYCCHFSNLQFEGEFTEAIGLFKSETKEPYLTVLQEDAGFKIDYVTEAINIKKLDKGCLILNREKEAGYQVLVIDQTNRSEAVYWTDEFLQLEVRNDNFNQTRSVLTIYKDFVTTRMEDEFEISKTDKIDLLNRSIRYFKEKESFDLDEFGAEVIANPQGIESFRAYKEQYEQETQVAIGSNFEISDMAVRKQARIYKSILKLDRNFHVYIHGNKEYIERGFDAERNMHYYKLYFREEA